MLLKLSVNLIDSFKACDWLFILSITLLPLPILLLLLLMLALIVTFWKMFYLPSTLVSFAGVTNYVIPVVVFCYCFYTKLLLLLAAIREITFGDVILLLLFLSDDLNVIFVIDSLFELLLFEPEIELTLLILLIVLMCLGLTCCFDILLLSNPPLLPTLGLNVYAANDYLHSFSYF